MTGYYDYVLGLIPASLIGIVGFLSLVGLPLTSAVPIGSVVAVGLIGHAMFVRNPVAAAQAPPSDTTPIANGPSPESVTVGNGPSNAD